MNLYIALLVLNLLDITTGFIKAIDNKTVASHVMKKGIITKALQWVVVTLSHEIALVIPINFDLATYVIYYYFVMEGISILENVSDYLPVPEKLKNILESQKEKQEDK